MGCAASSPAAGASAGDVGITWQAQNSADGAVPRCFEGPHGDEIANGVSAGCSTGEWVSCSDDKTVALADWKAGRIVQVWRGHSRSVNRVVALQSDATAHTSGQGIYLSASRDTTLKLWRRGEDDAVATLAGHELTVSAVAAATDGSRAISGSRDSSLRLWDLRTCQLASRCHVSRNVVTCLKWVPDEPSLVAQGSEDLRLRLWDVRTLSKPAATLEGYIYFPLSVDCSGPYVCTGSNGFNNVGCEVRVWDRRKNAQVFEPLVGHEHAVMGLTLLRGIGGNGGGHAAGDGGGLYAASGSKDGEVRLWDVTSGGESLCSHRLPAGEGATGVASALAEETDAHLYVATSAGRVHAMAVDGLPSGEGPAGLQVVATGGVAPSETGN